MTQLKQVYKCEVCGNVVEVVHTGAGELVCCGEPMKLMEENTVDAALEKHVPVIEQSDSVITVRVGSEDHPMTDDHFIEWIELLVDGQIYRKHLTPGDEPRADFSVQGGDVSARAYCNLHGLWKSE